MGTQVNRCRLSDVYLDWSQVTHLGPWPHGSEAVLFSLQPIRLHRISVGPNAVDVHSDLLIKMVSARFLSYKALLFPSVISKYLVDRYFATMYISYSSSGF